MISLHSFFRWRVERTVNSWPRVIQRDIRQYLGLARKKFGADVRLHGRRTDQPYWILLPFWLKEKLGRRNGVFRGKHFMDDILWGQYCLFVFIRIQDDLFDKHTERPPLIYASDLFLFEAERVFSKYFHKASAFWNIYRSCIVETILAIASGDSMERKPVRNRERLLSAHGRTSTICNVAPAALCLKAGRIRDFKRVSVFATEMMKTGAIVDDLQDLEEDLERGRFNYAASFFLHGIRMKKSGKKIVRRQIVRNVLLSDGLTRLFQEINRHMELAERSIKPIAVPAANKYLQSYRRSIAIMENDIHRWRVRTIFGSRIGKM